MPDYAITADGLTKRYDDELTDWEHPRHVVLLDEPTVGYLEWVPLAAYDEYLDFQSAVETCESLREYV